ncbi:hypothetical protein Q0M94_04470 [Deinococcus radiomollis]|uniref:hypothetical protein n=1 Tax=Deinococcus radiomollis TaxID=468916 RepID=UPI0038925EBA
MTRFLPYRFREQAGDELLFEDMLGGERRVPFTILDVTPPNFKTPLFMAWPTTGATGAWLRHQGGAFMFLPAPTADNEIDALSRFLHVLRKCGVIYDQVDRIIPLMR